MTTMPVDDAVRLIRSRIPARARLVGIDGYGGGGKSTLADRLAAATGAQVVHIDDFYLPSAEQGGSRGGHGRLFDLERLREQALEPLRAGRTASPDRYDWETDRVVAGERTVTPEACTIVEGVYALRADLRSYYDASVWVDCDEAVRLGRGLERDGQQARARWVGEWMPMERAYAVDERPAEAATVRIDASGGDDGLVYRLVDESRAVGDHPEAYTGDVEADV
jgi:uridine kinase